MENNYQKNCLETQAEWGVAEAWKVTRLGDCKSLFSIRKQNKRHI